MTLFSGIPPASTKYDFTASARRAESVILYSCDPIRSEYPVTVMTSYCAPLNSAAKVSRACLPAGLTVALPKSNSESAEKLTALRTGGGGGGGGGGAICGLGFESFQKKRILITFPTLFLLLFLYILPFLTPKIYEDVKLVDNRFPNDNTSIRNMLLAT